MEHDGDDGMIVTFSDGTSSGYVVEEVLELRPYREPSKAKKGSENNGAMLAKSSSIPQK